MMKNPRKTLNLEAIIGSVSQKYNQSLKNDLKPSITSNSKIKKQSIETYEIQGLKIPAKINKIPESFKINKHLKDIVENVVIEAKKVGYRISKGQVYNHLIEIGLKNQKVPK